MARLSFILALAVSALLATPPFPAIVTLPAAVSVPNVDNNVEEAYGEGDFPFGDKDNRQRGHHVQSRLKFAGVEYDEDQKWRPKVWNPIRTSLIAGGWVVKDYQDTNPPMATLQYLKGGVEAWIRMQLFNPEDITFDFVEVKPFTSTLTLPSPAPTPEKIAEDKPFPYLAPMPGGTMGGGDPDNGAMYVKFKGDEESTMVAPATLRKDYHGMPKVSNLQFILEYRSALTKAGWQIVEESQGFNQSDATLTAHYAKGSRDIWAYLHFGGGDLSVSVGEASDLAAALKKDCHVPLYGITFDFNKTTLRPDSEGALQRIVGVLQADAALAIEVQGHTDNVGGDDYNQKLSQGRADAVKTWLVAHSIPATRITTKGYGRQQPIAPNDSDEGRAKNRRVEIARAGCK